MNDRLRDRLRDEDPAIARAAALVASVPVIATSEARKERVRRSVLATKPQLAWMPLLLRPGVAIMILLIAGAVAAATLGRQSILRTYQQLTGPAASLGRENPSPAASRPPQSQPAATTAPAVTPEPALVEAVAPASAARPAPVAAPTKPTADGLRTSRTAGRVPPAPTRIDESPAEEPSPPPSELAPPAKAAPTQETLLIMTAVRALRREHDASRAGSLLEEYLRRFPSGVLAEEALALAIEAASARGDTRAAVLARTYLHRYPQGRFLRAARAAAE
jgi:hypothetical protein